ncbi:hypothetical protein IFR05_001484 [Cadophora sp. M221]|nr:hypothetical protein IFR05_001484 [Cadophora sp. M221]
MSGTPPFLSSQDAEKSRRDRETEHQRKSDKQKIWPVKFSDPGTLVTLIAGKDETYTKFLVHKEVACHHSRVWLDNPHPFNLKLHPHSPAIDVLKAAFESDFIEGQTQTYRLEESTKGAVTFLMQFLYSQKLHTIQLNDDCSIEDFQSKVPGMNNEDHVLVELWTLGDLLHIPKLQNVALKAIHAIQEKANRVRIHSLKDVYSLTSSGSLLRKYFVEVAVFNMTHDGFDYCPDHYPHEMLLDVIRLMRTERYIEMIKTNSIGNYYVEVSDFFLP